MGDVEYQRDRALAMANRHPALLWVSDESGMCTDFNTAWLDFRGRGLSEEIGTGWLEGVHPEDTDRCMTTYLEHFAERTPFEMEYRLQRADGEYRLILDAGAPWFLADGAFAGFVGSCLDITDHVRVRRALAESTEVHRATLESLHEGVLACDVDGVIRSANPAARRLLGRTAGELVGMSLSALAGDIGAVDEAGEPVPGDLLPAMAAVRSGRSVTGTVIGVVGADGRVRWLAVSATPLVDPDTGTATGVVTSFADVTEHKAIADSYRYEAAHDDLTGLVNRAGLRERIRAVIHDDRPHRGNVAVLYCDVDRFKEVNDSAGHDGGDEVLRVVAHRVQAAVRSHDVVARVGGDEMVVVLDSIPGEEIARAVAEKIRAAVALPVPVGDLRITPTLSIGIALVDSVDDIPAAISRADAAMYSAKSHGRDRIEVSAG